MPIAIKKILSTDYNELLPSFNDKYIDKYTSSTSSTNDCYVYHAIDLTQVRHVLMADLLSDLEALDLDLTQ